MASVLVVADPDTARTMCALLAEVGHATMTAETLAEARRVAGRHAIGAALLDAVLPDGAGSALIPELRRRHGRAPVLILTGDDGMEATIVAMRDGAFDCIPKPIDPERLLGRLEDALRLTPAQAIAVPQVPEADRAAELVGSSPAMREVFKKLGLLAASRATVLLLGESGTGKELAARVLHDYGANRGAPFVAVHCAALPRPLVEAEIFGHRKGAFTGADRDKPGKLELAGEGTFFLDEVGEIPLETQVKLLRVLQERQFERLGDTQPRDFRARVVAATHRDLEALVEAGQFREDLYYRLNVATVTIPPLRERREDLPQIASRLLGDIAREVGRRVDGLSVAALDRLCASDWPGNVRQLRNALTHAAVRCRGRIIDLDDLSDGDPSVTGTGERADTRRAARPATGRPAGPAPATRASPPPPPTRTPPPPPSQPRAGGAGQAAAGVAGASRSPAAEPPARSPTERNAVRGTGPVARPPGAAGPSRPGVVRDPPRPAERFPTLVEVEREHVRRALELAGGHRGKACSLLGVSRPTLLRKLRKYGLIDPSEPVDPDLGDGGDDDEDEGERDVPTGGQDRTIRSGGSA